MGSSIGISINADWNEAIDYSRDFNASQRINEYRVSWFLDPIYFGDYPTEMRNRIKERLPRFSEEDKITPKSLDFIGLNHYTSRFAKEGVVNRPNENNIYFEDMDVTTTPILENGTTIGFQLEPSWLWVSPTGIRKIVK
jgi:beta-glucosidase